MSSDPHHAHAGEQQAGRPQAQTPMATKLVTTGPALASLLLDITTADGTVEGLIWGTRTQSTVTETKDAGVQSSTLTTTVMWSFAQLGRAATFYDQYGVVDAAYLDSLCAAKSKTLIGWYRYRRNAPLRPGLREIAVQDSLTAYLSRRHPECASAVFGLLCAVSVDDSLAHDYRFFDGRAPALRAHELSISNLIDSSAVGYAFASLASQAADCAPTATKLGVVAAEAARAAAAAISGYAEGVLREVAAACDEVVSSTAEVLQLERDIAALEAEAAARASA